MKLSPQLSLASLLLNAILLGAVSWFALKQPPQMPEPSAQDSAEAAPRGIAPLPPKPFHWKQIDSPDFATFVRNLRGIGCPEATIRHIVQAELQQAYLDKRQQLQAALTTLPQGTERAKLQQEFQLLDQEEAQVLQSLVEAQGAPKAENSPASASAAPTPKTNVTAIESIPTAFLVGNDPSQPTLRSPGELSVIPTDPRLAPQDTQILRGMRDRFAGSLGDSVNDPASAAYKKKWATARRDSDDFFSSMYGGDNYIRMQLEAYQRAAAEAAAQGK